MTEVLSAMSRSLNAKGLNSKVDHQPPKGDS
jgi:hypothetical protein